MPRFNVLVVEGDKDGFVTMREHLSVSPLWGFDLKRAPDFHAGLRGISSGRYDACLVAHRLGQRDGLDFIQEARRRGVTTPIILLGDSGAEGVQALEMGAADYLVKGETTPSLLERSIRYAVDRGRRGKELRNERNKMQRYLDTTDTIIVALDESGTVTMLNRYGLELLGYRQEEIIGKDWFKTVLPQLEGTGKVKQLFQRIIKGQIGSTGYMENEIITSSGRRLLIAWRNTVLRDGEGRIVGTLSAGMDITDRKRAEEALRESEEKYRTLFDQLVDAIFLHDLEGNILDVNRVAVLHSGYSKEELLSSTVFDFIPAEARKSEILRSWAQWPLGRRFTIETTHRRKDGSLYPVEVTTGRVGFGNRRLILASVRDITERRQAEEALRRSHDELEIRVHERTSELERKNQELQEFTFIAAHDLSEPLRKIQVFGSLLEERVGNRLSEQEREYLSRMKAVAGRMHELLNAILAYSRLETNGIQFRPARLGDIVRDAVDDLEATIGELRAQVEIGPLPSVTGEPNQLRQLFQNLISNSLKYSRPGVAPLVRVHGEEGNGSYRIFVKDNGIGFDEKYLENIFKPFQRLHSKDEYLGTGIGLAICKKIAERHRGNITASSTPGKGSTFILTLPAGKVRKGVKPRPSRRKSSLPEKGGGGKRRNSE